MYPGGIPVHDRADSDPYDGVDVIGYDKLLGAKYFVADLVANSASAMRGFLPMIIFLVAAFLAFATGTSWGTFSILIPIVIGVFPEGQMMVIPSHPVWRVQSAETTVHRSPTRRSWHLPVVTVNTSTMW